MTYTYPSSDIHNMATSIWTCTSSSQVLPITEKLIQSRIQPCNLLKPTFFRRMGPFSVSILQSHDEQRKVNGKTWLAFTKCGMNPTEHLWNSFGKLSEPDPVVQHQLLTSQMLRFWNRSTSLHPDSNIWRKAFPEWKLVKHRVDHLSINANGFETSTFWVCSTFVLQK